MERGAAGLPFPVSLHDPGDGLRLPQEGVRDELAAVQDVALLDRVVDVGDDRDPFGRNQPELPDRRARLARFRSSAREITPLASGYKLVFDLDEPTFREATDLILAESRCCGFLEFRLTVQPAHKLLALEISGPAGTKEFLASVVGPVENRGEESGDSR